MRYLMAGSYGRTIQRLIFAATCSTLIFSACSDTSNIQTASRTDKPEEDPAGDPSESDLDISLNPVDGQAVIPSSMKRASPEVHVTITDPATGEVIDQTKIKTGIKMTLDLSPGADPTAIQVLVSPKGKASPVEPYIIPHAKLEIVSIGSNKYQVIFQTKEVNAVFVAIEAILDDVEVAPDAPTGLSIVVVSGTELDVSWTDNASSETGFKLDRSTDGTSYAEVATPAANTTSFSDTGLSPGQIYYYRIRASNLGGDSDYSNVDSATTPPVPAAPTGLSVAVVSGTELDVSWTDNASNETGFKLERSTDGSSYAEVATPAADATTFSDTGLAPGQMYYYRIRANNLSGDSAYSNVDSDTPPTAPTAPSALSVAVVSGTELDVSWTDNANNETGFKLERSTDGSSYAEVATPAADATSFSDTGLAPGQMYYYRIRANNLSGDSAYSNVDSDTPPTAPTAPSALSVAVVSGTELDVSWTDNANNETGFKLERSTDGSSYAEVATPAANATTFSDTGLTPGQIYYYRIRSSNLGGDSAYSNVDSDTPPTAPTAPSSLSVAIVSGTELDVSWTDNGNNETGFKLERSTDGSSYAEVATPAANATTFSDTGLTPGQVYYYRIRSSNLGGDSAYSNVDSAVPSAVYNWPFTTTGNYTYDSNSVSVTGGHAVLKTSAFTDSDNTASGFGGGTHFGTQWDAGNNWLEIANSAPFPDNGISEIGYDMTGNVLLLHLDESSGNATDTSPSGNTTTVTGATYSIAAPFGTGMTIGTSGGVRVADSANIDIGASGQYSFAGWFKTSASTGTRALLDKRTLSPETGYHLMVESGYIRIRINNGGTALDTTTTIGSAVWADNAWHHVVWVIDRDAGRSHIYMDGQPYDLNRDISTTSGSWANTADLVVGGHIQGAGFNGSIDEFAFFQRAIGSTEAADLYSRGTNKIAYFRSRVIGTGTSQSWDELAWNANRPSVKQLPCNGATETGYPNANMNMSGNLLLMKFDELSWSGVSDEVENCASSSHQGTAVSGANTVADGVFNRAGRFDLFGGTTVEAGNDVAFDFEGTDPFTISAWVNTTTSSPMAIVSKYEYYGVGVTRGYALLMETSGKITFDLTNYLSNGDAIKRTDPRQIADGRWHQVTVTYDGSMDASGLIIYVDGTASGSVTTVMNGLDPGESTLTTEPLRVGGTNAGNHQYDGKIDEVAIWNRTLTPGEVESIYSRSAQRVEFQVRSCSDATCSADPAFIGPDGTSGTSYSELLNNTLIAPLLTLQNVVDNSYLQYQIKLTGLQDDSLTPQISSVSVGPGGSYLVSKPTIVTQSGPTFATLTSFSSTAGSGSAGEIRYQLSIDGSNWYYVNAGNWTLASSVDDSSVAADIDAQAASFHSDVGTGQLYLKAVLFSDGTQAVELDNVRVSYTAP